MYDVLIYSPMKQGGVARVAENLKIGFDAIGTRAEIAYGFLPVLNYIRRRGVSETLFIGSLEGGLFSFFFKRSIYILHGFPSPSHYGFLRFLLIAVATKVFSAASTCVVSVSSLTKMVNWLFLGIKSNAVIHNSSVFSSLAASSETKNPRIIYVGRMIKEKGVLTILSAFKLFSVDNPDYELVFVGEGPCEGLLKNLSVGYPVKFEGAVYDSAALSKIYSGSEIFISLNESEPFGIVFLEAMHHNLKIIAPVTGGQREFIPTDFPAIYVADWDNADLISTAMREAAALQCSFNFHKFADKFAPRYMATQYLNLLNR